MKTCPLNSQMNCQEAACAWWIEESFFVQPNQCAVTALARSLAELKDNIEDLKSEIEQRPRA